MFDLKLGTDKFQKNQGVQLRRLVYDYLLSCFKYYDCAQAMNECAVILSSFHFFPSVLSSSGQCKHTLSVFL